MWSAGPATNHDSIDFCHLHIYAGPNGGGRDPWIETVRILGRDLTLQHYVLRIMQMSFRSFKFKLVTGPLHKIRRFTRVLLITSTNNNRASTVILLLHLVINKNAFEEMY